MSPQSLTLLLETKQPPNLPRGASSPCRAPPGCPGPPCTLWGATRGSAETPNRDKSPPLGPIRVLGGIVSGCANEAVSMETGSVSAPAPCNLFIYLFYSLARLRPPGCSSAGKPAAEKGNKSRMG